MHINGKPTIFHGVNGNDHHHLLAREVAYSSIHLDFSLMRRQGQLSWAFNQHFCYLPSS